MAEDHLHVARMHEILRDEIEDYTDGRGHWEEHDVSKCARIEPWRYWAHRAPKDSPLRFYALKITSPNPVTSAVERMHKSLGANRIKTKTKLRFSVNQALAFLGDHLHKEKKTGMSWNEQIKAVDSFLKVLNKVRLERLVAQQASEEERTRRRSKQLLKQVRRKTTTWSSEQLLAPAKTCRTLTPK